MGLQEGARTYIASATASAVEKCSAELSNAKVMLQDCSLQGGQIQANASCISGLVCCDATCAAALGASSLQVGNTGVQLLASWIRFHVSGMDRSAGAVKTVCDLEILQCMANFQ